MKSGQTEVVFTIINLEDVVRHPDGDGGGEDCDPGGQDQVLGVRGRPQGQGAHREHNSQKPGENKYFSSY